MKHECLIYALLKEGDVFYVGRSKDFRRRLVEHRASFGRDFIFQIVDRCSENCRGVERDWILFYLSLGCKLENKDYSGHGGHFHSNTTREYLAQINRRPVTWGDKIAATLRIVNKGINKGTPVTWGDKISASQKGIPRDQYFSEDGLEKAKASRFKLGH